MTVTILDDEHHDLACACLDLLVDVESGTPSWDERIDLIRAVASFETRNDHRFDGRDSPCW